MPGKNAAAVMLEGSNTWPRLEYVLIRILSSSHAARATAATNALDAGADIAKVQAWLGHANVSTTRVYDHRKTRPEDSPVFKVKY